MNKKVNLIISTYLILFLFIYFLIGLVFYYEFNDHNLNFYMLDVGQGDALLIRTPNNRNILIDGGPDNTVVYKLGKYLPFYDRSIDLMILTHPHADHLMGLIEVINRYQVKKILVSNVVYNTPQVQAWYSLIQEKNIELILIDKSRVIELDEDIYLYILWPVSEIVDKNLNNFSIVAKLVYGQASIMLMGDLEREEELSSFWPDLSADILKVGHHGSHNANDAEFLAQVNSSIAIISAGEGNKFKHPHQSTVSDLLNLGAVIYRTDLLGDLHFISSGINFEYQP